ncbi:MAG: hypothetical protein JNM66_24415 [Bryobacterales bacterium]|nr:hypothetical protein [Bryobacterales bacterium]
MRTFLLMSILLHIGPSAAAEYTAPDNSFTLAVPAGWRVRVAPLNGALAGQHLTVIEPANGGEERIVVGAGVAMAANIQELSQQAAALAGQYLPGARLLAAPVFARHAGLPMVEQEYQTYMQTAWNGVLLKGEFYFGVMAIARPAQREFIQRKGREILQSARFNGLLRNLQLERLVAGSWINSDNRTRNTGVRDKLMYMSSWTVAFSPDGRFRSVKESFVDTSSEVYAGGNVGAANTATGRYRVYGNTLVAEFDGGGRQLFSLDVYPNGNGINVNGQLFTRQ